VFFWNAAAKVDWVEPTMSSCCLMNNPGQGRGAAPRGDAPAEPAAGRGARGGGLANALFAPAAAWAPNPLNPPQYFDLPTKDGVVRPLIAAKWIANSPLVRVDQYVPSLKRYTAIALDVGDKDPLGAANKDLDQALTRLEFRIHSNCTKAITGTASAKDFRRRSFLFFKASEVGSSGTLKKRQLVRSFAPPGASGGLQTHFPNSAILPVISTPPY
jgi:hypothetical protein